jgi:gliding motility-associated-like protein
LGNDVNGSVCYSDFYRFDPVSNSYSQMANSPIARSVPAHFVIGSLGYIGLGFIPHSPYVARDFTTFDPANGALGTWTAISNFTGVPRGWGFSDTVGGKPYVGAGSDFIGGIYYYDLWTWDSCSIIVNLGRDTTLCLGASITLADTFSNATSLWSTGDTSRSITVSSSGRYWLKVTQATCTGSDTINVSFVPPSNIDLGHDTAYCGTFSRVLATGINSTLWSNGYVAPSITVANPGLYWAQLTSLCGVIRDSITISDNPLPVVNLGNDTNLCSGSTVLLDATTANANYEWQDGSTNPTFMVRTAGTYSVVVTINGCGNRDSIAVGYINPPIFYIGGDTAYCGSFNRILTAGIPYTIWSNGDTALSIAIDSPGVYWGSIAGCNNILKDSIVIYENTIPHVNIGNDTILCAGDTLTLSALTLDANYLWQDGSVNATFVISAPGVYWVDVTVKGCTKSDSITIDQLRPPSISLANDTTICQDSTLALTVYAMFSQYHWSNGDTASSILVNQSGQYTVTVSNTCGSTIASENITLEQCNCTVRIPTAFSPNDDNRNDKFWVLTHCPLENFELDIYDRWGQKIFLSNSVTTKWDGTYKGAQQPLGVYVYVIRYTDPYTGADISQTGNVTLLR